MESTQLKDRVLLYNGKSVIDPEYLEDFILEYGLDGSDLLVSQSFEELDEYNLYAPDEEKVVIYNECQKNICEYKYDTKYNIPRKYLTMDVEDYVMKKHLSSEFKDDAGRLARIQMELNMFHERKLMDFLRVIIYVVDIFENDGVVWGVGRGSSVSSYVLYVIGVHDIDSFKYNIDIKEFLK
jgi:DNA polymerase III alpha subunit